MTSDPIKRLRPRYDSYSRRQRASKQAASSRFRAVTVDPGDRATTVSQVFDAFLATLIREDSSSRLDYQSIIELWLRPAFGDLHPNDLTLAIQDAWLRSIPGASNSLGNRYACLRSAFEHARLAGLVEVNPCTLPKSARPSRRPRPGFDAGREIVSIELLARISSCARIPRARQDLYVAAHMTGARVNELGAWQWKDIQWSREFLASAGISKSWSRKNKRLHTTKTGGDRDAPLHPALHARLWDRWASGWEAQFGRAPTPDDLVFPHRKSNGELVHMVDRLVLRRWHRDLRCVGETKRRFHALRHSFVTTWCQAGADPHVIRAITHPRTMAPRGGSFGLYRHFSWEEKCKAILAVEMEGIE